MRLTQVFAVIAAVISVSSEALLTTADTKLTKAQDFDAGPSQRILRIHHKTKEAGDEYEDRLLELGELKSLKARGFTKEAYAKHLGIEKELEVFKKNLFYNDLSYVEFAQTTEFKKYQAYQNFLHDLKKAAQEKKKPQGCCMS